jgi:hypothetical protein
MPSTVRPSSSEFPHFPLVRYPLAQFRRARFSAVFDGFSNHAAPRIVRKIRGSAVFAAPSTVKKPGKP